MTFAFEHLWPVAEWWRPDNDYHSAGCVGFLDTGEHDYEQDILELGEYVADELIDENEGPDYRKWERVDAIAWRLQSRSPWCQH